MTTPKAVFTAIMGLVAVARGVGYIVPEGVPAGLQTLDHVAPLEWWGWAWALVGLVALAGALAGRVAVPLIAAAMINACWCLSYGSEWAYSWIAGAVSRDWITALSYLAQTVACIVVVRLIDPGEIREAVSDG